MAYDGSRSYLTFNLAAQNIIATASNHVVTDANTIYIPIAEATFVCSLAGVIQSASSNLASTIKYALLSGTTTIGTIAPAQTAGSSAFSTFTPPVAVASGAALTISVIGTGTASATETASQINLAVGVAPQYV